MKTITLSDSAYDRLKEWKEPPDESFSAVVLRRVPKRGTLRALAEALASLPPLPAAEAEAWLAERENDREQERGRDPWTR